MDAIVELPWALDAPPAPPRTEDMSASEGAPATVDDPGALTRGVLVGLGVSVPLWLGAAWLAATLLMR